MFFISFFQIFIGPVILLVYFPFASEVDFHYSWILLVFMNILLFVVARFAIVETNLLSDP